MIGPFKVDPGTVFHTDFAAVWVAGKPSVGIRGPGGGYELVGDVEQINVSEILTAVGEGFDATRCGGSGDCQDGQTCLTHELWSDLSMQIDLFLSRITLASLIERGDIMSIARRLEDVNLIEARLI